MVIAVRKECLFLIGRFESRAINHAYVLQLTVELFTQVYFEASCLFVKWTSKKVLIDRCFDGLRSEQKHQTFSVQFGNSIFEVSGC